MDKLQLLSSVKLESQTLEHPNKQYFRGILTTIDSPSHRPPVGSKGKNVVLARSAVEKAMGTLIGMPINASDELSGHQQDAVVGIINNAYVEGNNVIIEGHLFPQNNPEICASIKAEKEDLGFSYELLASEYNSNDITMVVTEFTFIGACVLYKSKAAYGTDTQLIAAQNSNSESDLLMEFTKEELQAMLSEMLGKFEEKLVEVKAGFESKVETVVSEVKAEVEKFDSKVEELGVKLEASVAELKVVPIVQASAEPIVEPNANIPAPSVVQTIVANSDVTPIDDKQAKIKEIQASNMSMMEKLREIAKLG